MAGKYAIGWASGALLLLTMVSGCTEGGREVPGIAEAQYVRVMVSSLDDNQELRVMVGFSKDAKGEKPVSARAEGTFTVRDPGGLLLGTIPVSISEGDYSWWNNAFGVQFHAADKRISYSQLQKSYDDTTLGDLTVTASLTTGSGGRFEHSGTTLMPNGLTVSKADRFNLTVSGKQWTCLSSYGGDCYREGWRISATITNKSPKSANPSGSWKVATGAGTSYSVYGTSPSMPDSMESGVAFSFTLDFTESTADNPPRTLSWEFYDDSKKVASIP